MNRHLLLMTLAMIPVLPAGADEVTMYLSCPQIDAHVLLRPYHKESYCGAVPHVRCRNGRVAWIRGSIETANLNHLISVLPSGGPVWITANDIAAEIQLGSSHALVNCYIRNEHGWGYVYTPPRPMPSPY